MKKPKITAFVLGILFVSGCGGKTSDNEDTWEIVIVDGMATVPAGTYAEGTELEASVLGFELDVTEVTVEAYQACVDDGACEPGRAASEEPDCNTGAAGRQEHPINCVTARGSVIWRRGERWRTNDALYVHYSALVGSPKWAKRFGPPIRLKRPWSDGDGRELNTTGCSALRCSLSSTWLPTPTRARSTAATARLPTRSPAQVLVERLPDDAYAPPLRAFLGYC